MCPTLAFSKCLFGIGVEGTGSSNSTYSEPILGQMQRSFKTVAVGAKCGDFTLSTTDLGGINDGYDVVVGGRETHVEAARWTVGYNVYKKRIGGFEVGLDTGSRNYLSRIVEQNLAKLSTLWRTGNLRLTVNHNSISGGAIDPTDILVDRWYMFTVTFDRVAGLIKLYRNGVFVAQFTNTTALTAFQGYIGCIELSNGFRAGAVGANIAAIYYHKRELAATEVASLKTFLTNKFSVTLG